MKHQSSYGQILRATSIIGGASVLNIAIGLVRTKVAALLLGPAGVGLIGLFQSLMATASLIAGMGTNTVGTRQVAEAVGRDDIEAIAVARKSLLLGVIGLSLMGAFAFWSVRDLLADRVFQGSVSSDSVGWLSVGVALSVVAGSQTALLNGLRRLGDLARLSVFAGVLSSLLGCGALFLFHDRAIVFFVLCAPLCSVLVGYIFVKKIEVEWEGRPSLSKLSEQWRLMATLGGAFMVSGVVGAAGQLFIRTVVQDELGSIALGQFQASWSISNLYIGFVLSAMGSDYYPRLTAAMNDKEQVVRLVNEQTEIALMLSAPLFFLMLGFAPLVIKILYSAEFTEAAFILRWQVLGDILKVISWPLGFVILASGNGRTYMLTESLAIGVLSLCVWLGLPFFGLKATSAGYIAMYLVLTPVVYWFAAARTGFAWSGRVLRMCVLICSIALSVVIFANFSEFLAAVVGAVSSLIFLFYGVLRIAALNDGGGVIGRKVKLLLEKFGVVRD